jgi:hypothetical protein
MARSKKPPSWSPVAIERDGKAYSGKFYVDGRLITVLYNGRTKTTQLGGSDATAIASRLLSELLPENKLENPQWQQTTPRLKCEP